MATILSLPVELWESICRYVIEAGPEWPASLTIWRLRGLRLSCKTISHKINDYFARSAFKVLRIHIDLAGLDRLTGIARDPFLAPKVEMVYITEYDRHDCEWESYNENQRISNSTESTQRQRTEAHMSMRHARIEQDEKDFIERSGADSIAMAMAFQQFPNLKEVIISPGHDDRPSIRQHLAGSSYTTTRAFSMLASCLPYTISSIKRLGICSIGCSTEQGISMQALSLPQTIRKSFASLHELDITIETVNRNYRSK